MITVSIFVKLNFCNGLFKIDAKYAEELRHKIRTFQEQSKTRKALFLTMITPFGVHNNRYANELVQQQLTLEDLF